MSQKTVQLLIGRIVTDEDLRRLFVAEPLDALNALREQGVELTDLEVDALVRTDKSVWEATAKKIHPRLQRCSLRSNGRE